MTPHPATFIRTVILTTLVACAAVAAVDYAVDPFDIFRAATVEGVNRVKPTKYTRVRLLKAAAVERIKPEAVVLGTSRSHIGLRMMHPGWDPAAARRYNLAFDGATTREMYLYLRHAQAVQPLRQVVLGLDTWHLMNNPSPARPDFDPAFLRAGAGWGGSFKTTLARLRVLLSVDTLTQSYRTLARQGDGAEDWFAPDGQRLGDRFFHREAEDYVTLGPATYFRTIDRQEIGYRKAPAAPTAGVRKETRDAPPSLDDIARIIAFCRANAIDLRIFITPAHVHQLEISSALGEWTALERGKRALVDLLRTDAASHPGGAAFPLWDFSDYSSVTTENIPADGSRTEMANYWDPSHFKENVGDWVLDRLFNMDGAPADFGTRLTEDTITTALAATRAKQLSYQQQHPQDVAALRQMSAAGAAGPTVSASR